jgi:two-component sensor histidine kinase
MVLRVEAEHVPLRVHDTGIGVPMDRDFRRAGSLGLQFVCMLSQH